MAEIWIYENWTHDRVRVHLGGCGYCNHGKGLQSSDSGRNGKWHGPFDDREKVMQMVKKMGRSDTKNCANCIG